MKGYLAVMVIAIAVLFTQINWYYYFDEAVYFTHAVKAVVFGLLGAIAVLIAMLPTSTNEKKIPPSLKRNWPRLPVLPPQVYLDSIHWLR